VNWSLNPESLGHYPWNSSHEKIQNITFYISGGFFYLRGSFESPVWVPDGCEIPNMRPLLVYSLFPGNNIKWLWISPLSSSTSHQDFSSFMVCATDSPMV
jgi:hypothetical protein